MGSSSSRDPGAHRTARVAPHREHRRTSGRRLVQGKREWVRFETMLKIRKIEHVAIAVNDIDQALVKYREVLGLTPTAREHVSSQKTDAALLPLGESSIELIAPRGNEGLARFLEKRGPGLHHIALEIEGIDEAL